MSTALEPREQQPQLGAAPEQQQPAPPAAPLKRLSCAVQNYAWGRHAQDSEVSGASAWGAVGHERASGGGGTRRLPRSESRLPTARPVPPPCPCPQVAQLAAAAGSAIDPDKPYAELW